MFEASKIYNQIRRYPIISFDIFDTLIKRNVADPKDIFNIVEEQFNGCHPERVIRNFRENRIHAERKARESCSREEVTFKGIYQQIDLAEELREELMRLEENTELQFCQANYLVKGLYDRCVAEGHTVIITSDMYLPKDLIIEILQKCGYDGYAKLYLSSEIGLKKSTGHLYDYLVDDLNVSAKEIIHIGDGKKTDNLLPRQRGIKSLCIKRMCRNTHILTKNDVYASESPLVPFLNNNLPKYCTKSNLFQWGYEALGPLLLGFTVWVHGQLKENDIERACFLARDMYLVIDIYRKLYGNENIEYLEISRRSLRSAYVKKEGKFSAVFDTMARKSYTFQELLQSLDIETSVLNDKFDFTLSVTRDNYAGTGYDKLNQAVLDILSRRKDLTESYLAQMGLLECKRLAIIDIGWHSTIQNMLERLLGKPVLGLYFGNTTRGYYPKMDSRGYWFSLDDEASAKPYLSMSYILETMLFQDIGTTVGYVETEDGIKPQYATSEMFNFEKIEQFQCGANAFVDDYIKFEPRARYLSQTETIKAYRKMALDPTLAEAKTLGDLPYEDGKIYSLAKPHPFHFYIRHPFSLLKGYKEARWKEGFMKQILPFIPQPHKITFKLTEINGKYLGI